MGRSEEDWSISEREQWVNLKMLQVRKQQANHYRSIWSRQQPPPLCSLYHKDGLFFQMLLCSLILNISCVTPLVWRNPEKWQAVWLLDLFQVSRLGQLHSVNPALWTQSVGKMSTRTLPYLGTKISKLYNLIAKQETENLNFLPTLLFVPRLICFTFKNPVNIHRNWLKVWNVTIIDPLQLNHSRCHDGRWK